MDSIVPFLALITPESEELLSRTRYIVEHNLGHDLQMVTAGSALSVQKLNPLLARVPFVIEVVGTVENETSVDIWEPIKRAFPSAKYIFGNLNTIPQILNRRREELSLGHIKETSPDFVRLIYKNISRKHYDLKKIAQDAGMSRSTLERYSRHIGERGTFHFLHETRMSEAHRMVLETQATINDIAASVGYDDLASFDRAFRRAWNTSPSEMRRNANVLRRTVK